MEAARDERHQGPCVRIYGVEGGERDEIEDLAVRCRVRPWWREYGEIFDNEFPGYENDATSIRVFMPLVLPGLLQIPAYTEALMRAGPRPPAYRRRALESRQRRQEVLDRTDGSAPMFSAVITEASLLYRWGMREDRREQIEHLVELSKRRNVQLHIQRFEDGPPIGIVSMVNILGFRDDEPSLVFCGDRLLRGGGEQAGVSAGVHRIVPACLRCRA